MTDKCANCEAMGKEVERLRAIVDRLPKTADLVPVIPCQDDVWHTDHGQMHVSGPCGRDCWTFNSPKRLKETEMYRTNGSVRGIKAQDCYSTRAAAESAARAAMEGKE